MRPLILLLALILSFSAAGQEFHRKTKHKPIKRMKVSDVKKAQVGVYMYTQENGKVVRNNGKAWTKITRPKDNSGIKPRDAERIRKDSERYQRKIKRSYKKYK